MATWAAKMATEVAGVVTASAGGAAACLCGTTATAKNTKSETAGVNQ